MEQKTPWFTAPPLQNCSCSHPRYSSVRSLAHLTIGDVLQASVILCLSLGILLANILVIIVINSRQYSKRIHSQPRYLLTSLASNDLAIGLMVTPFGFLPALYKCWPYGELLCQIQALLKGALCQQSAIILICMAVDRYMCTMHPITYYKRSGKKGCVAIISITWITTLSLFAVIVLPKGGYYFNHTGLLACDPFYTKISFRILSSCSFYFPTTMILMYCYGTAFHVNKPKSPQKCSEFPKNAVAITASPPPVEKLDISGHRSGLNVSRTMAAMSLGFIVMVTPWTIQEVVTACTGYKVPPSIDFSITWLALSHSFWNPFFYWFLNEEFREISKQLLFSAGIVKREKRTNKRVQCCNTNSNGSIPINSVTSLRADLAGLSEKYWGEILESTVSSSGLQAMQKERFFPPPPPPPLSFCQWKQEGPFKENRSKGLSPK